MESHANSRYASLRILIVDDSSAIRQFLKQILNQLGVAQTREAVDGNEALRQLTDTQSEYDLMFCDLAMPGMDGVELLREVGRICPSITVLTISSMEPRLRASVDKMLTALKLQSLGSLPKPFTADDIIAALDQYLSLKEGHGTKIGALSNSAIRDALTQDRIIPYFQPKVRIDNGHLVGVEVLARLKDSREKIFGPSDFIDAAETGGKMWDLTYRLIDSALRHAGDWLRQGLKLSVGINLSASSIARLDLPEHIEAVARNHGIDNASVTLEITETAMHEVAKLIDVCSRLRMRGFGLAIDDFGAGESGISRLSSLPFTELKIDKQYVTNSGIAPDNLAILQSSIELGHRLGMNVVAEGVESAEDWGLLDDLNCDMAQGFVISRPLPAKQVLPWAIRWQRNVSRGDTATFKDPEFSDPQRSRH